MKIETLKDLESVLKLCRKQGIDSLEIDGIKIVFGETPSKANLNTDNKDPETPAEPSEEDLLMWSVQNAGLNG